MQSGCRFILLHFLFISLIRILKNFAFTFALIHSAHDSKILPLSAVTTSHQSTSKSGYWYLGDNVEKAS
jgi:hypothetical protein